MTQDMVGRGTTDGVTMERGTTDGVTMERGTTDGGVMIGMIGIAAGTGTDIHTIAGLPIISSGFFARGLLALT
jgi:hypothetical protein